MATNTPTASRRGALISIAAATAIGAVPIGVVRMAHAASGDAEIVRLWRANRALFARIDRTEDEDAIRDLTDRIGDNEMKIRDLHAATPEGMRIKLLVGLLHMSNWPAVEKAILREDFPALYARQPDLDFEEQMVVATIRSLGDFAGRA